LVSHRFVFFSTYHQRTILLVLVYSIGGASYISSRHTMDASMKLEPSDCQHLPLRLINNVTDSDFVQIN